MTIKTETFELPIYWASYLVNGDDSGLEDREIAEIDSFLDSIPGWYCVGVGEGSYFSYSNDASSLGGDVAEFIFHKSEV